MTTETKIFEPTIESCAAIIAEESKTDIIFCNAPLDRPLDYHAIKAVRSRSKLKNVLLILVTEGGDPDVAYRIAKCLQENYENFSILVPGYCKSAGTLLSVGACNIIMTEHAELGPLDIQLAKKDNLGENQSVLTIPNALNALQSYAYTAFEQCFTSTIKRSKGRITTQTASKIATDLAVGLYAPIFQQIDPLHLGDVGRANKIAEHYGLRLLAKYKNINQEGLQFLITHYPSHGFVIDRSEAAQIFQRVRTPSSNENLLIEFLGDGAIIPDENPTFIFLNQELANKHEMHSNGGEKVNESTIEQIQKLKATGGKFSKRVAPVTNAGD